MATPGSSVEISLEVLSVATIPSVSPALTAFPTTANGGWSGCADFNSPALQPTRLNLLAPAAIAMQKYDDVWHLSSRRRQLVPTATQRSKAVVIAKSKRRLTGLIHQGAVFDGAAVMR